MAPRPFQKRFNNYREDHIHTHKLTIRMTTAGNAKRTIMIANHALLFDSAYARRAENARDSLAQYTKAV